MIAAAIAVFGLLILLALCAVAAVLGEIRDELRARPSPTNHTYSGGAWHPPEFASGSAPHPPPGSGRVERP